MHKVRITHRANGQSFESGRITLGAAGYPVAASDYFAEAWEAAVDDGLVEADRQADYKFELLPADAAST